MNRRELTRRAQEARDQMLNRDRPSPWIPIWTALGGMAAGVAGMLLLDPQRGKARRAEIVDRTAAAVRRVTRGAERQARRIGSEIEGKTQALQNLGSGDGAEPNDETLAEKVQSELFRDASIDKGSINVNVERGVVVLRGEVATAGARRKVESAARRIGGVRGVQNLLHLPGETAPVAG